MKENIKLMIKPDRSAERELSERAARQLSSIQPKQLSRIEKSIHFLRGVDSRASFTLVGFYMYLASNPDASNACNIQGYPGKVFQNYINHAALNNISLACRKAFDHSPKGALTGGMFAKINDSTLCRHAEYWANSSGQSYDDAYKALQLLRSFFKICAKSNSDLLKQESTLGRRIGLIKQYADRAASHLSLENYDLTVFDLAHLAASITLVGEIVRSFDRSSAPASCYNDIDEAAYTVAKEIFPDLIDIRLFQTINVERQARSCWKSGEERGLHMLLEQIPYATSFF